MPSRLKPTNPVAEDAILVGDPGRALMLAQELLVNPLMSNHARGLWGYTSATAEGRPLSIQATGMGGPSAAIVLNDLVKLGLRRAIRLGTCESLDPDLAPGTLVVAQTALAGDGTTHALLGHKSLDNGTLMPPRAHADATLLERLGGAGPRLNVLSVDLGPGVAAATGLAADPALHSAGSGAAAVCDLQTAALFALAEKLEVAVAALLVVERIRQPGAATTDGAGRPGPHRLDPEQLEQPMKAAGAVAASALSNP